VYTDRIDAVGRIDTGKASARRIVDSEARLAQTAEFQSSLAVFGIPGELSACDLMVEVIDHRGGRDRSLGAICMLNGKPIMVCNDTMIGKFTLKLSGFALTADSLVDFTANNCPRGG
jgi:hypothetical protein